MSLKILEKNDPFLTKIITGRAEPSSKEDRELGQQMFETMKENVGVGLSASQVGVDKRIICISCGPENHIMFNPEILKMSLPFVQSTEYCLSFPKEEKHNVLRASKVLVRWQTPKGKIKSKIFEGLAAICIQHEVAHLEGRTMEMDSFTKKAEAIAAEKKKEKENATSGKP